ncbi:MAG: hypothetical protein AB7F96_00855 [Beijerinckiaceae bacterium]
MGVQFHKPATGRPEVEKPAIAEPGAIQQQAVLAPMLAGAQARGMADMLEMLGQGAILVDPAAGVLHVSERARAMLEGVVGFTQGHMAGQTPEARDVLQRLVAATLAGNPACATFDTPAGRIIELQALPAPAGPPGTVQLLRSVICVRAHPGRRAASS